jgi:FtsP/CotA-like multicopper oxidase with cupredoxin domain
MSGAMPFNPTRRRMVQGLTATGLLAASGHWPSAVWAEGRRREAWSEVRWTDFDLHIAETAVDITGRERTALTVNGSLPAPTLRWREGDTVTLRVSNSVPSEPAAREHGRRAGAELPRHSPR